MRSKDNAITLSDYRVVSYSERSVWVGLCCMQFFLVWLLLHVICLGWPLLHAISLGWLWLHVLCTSDFVTCAPRLAFM